MSTPPLWGFTTHVYARFRRFPRAGNVPGRTYIDPLAFIRTPSAWRRPYSAGCFHMEPIYTDDGPRLIECNPRVGGGPIMEYHRRFNGVELAYEFMMTALNVPVVCGAGVAGAETIKERMVVCACMCTGVVCLWLSVCAWVGGPTMSYHCRFLKRRRARLRVHS
jgi:hypothetical protein